jgi:hypothetical protein
MTKREARDEMQRLADQIPDASPFQSAELARRIAEISEEIRRAAATSLETESLLTLSRIAPNEQVSEAVWQQLFEALRANRKHVEDVRNTFVHFSNDLSASQRDFINAFMEEQHRTTAILISTFSQLFEKLIAISYEQLAETRELRKSIDEAREAIPEKAIESKGA